MPASAAPDDARSRLRTLGADPRPPRWADPSRGRGWGGPETADIGGAEEQEPRVGWPTAAPGTPAARLRLDAVPGGRDARWRSASQHDGDDASWGSAPGPDDPPPRPRSAWDPPADGHGRWARWAARWLPGSWSGARWDPGRAGALALATVAAVAAVVAAVGVWSERPVAEPVPALPVVAPAPAPDSGIGPPGLQAAPATGPIVVSVSGRVRRPGLLRLPPGSRVGEAIDAAGGAEPDTDLTGLNLAARLADGEQVLVGVPVPVTPPAAGSAGSAGGATAAPGAPSASAPGGRLDLNSATLEQLDQLPGVGPVTAQRILEWRTQNGRFAAVEQLQEVSGIGEARFATLRDLVSV